MRGDGDGWARCARGHRHWGVFGAAGLLLWHDGAVLLQHRAEWSHHGGTWGILGGARDSGETAAEAAAREATEEAGLPRSTYCVGGEHVDDHGGWAYTTVIGRTDRALSLTALTAGDDRGALGARRRGGRAAAAPRVRRDVEVVRTLS